MSTQGLQVCVFEVYLHRYFLRLEAGQELKPQHGKHKTEKVKNLKTEHENASYKFKENVSSGKMIR